MGMLNSFERKTILFGKVGAAIAVLSFVAAALAGYAVYEQFVEMATQTDILSRGAKQARADSASASLVAAKQLQIAQAQATAAQDQVVAVKNQMRQERRAWIDPTLQPITIDRKGNGPINIEVDLMNIGVTPSKNTQYKIAFKKPKRHDVPTFVYSGEGIVTGFQNIVYPRDGVQVIVPYELSTTERAAIADGTTNLIVYGEVSYSDIFGVQHWAKFCRYKSDLALVSRDEITRLKCAHYNDTDKH